MNDTPQDRYDSRVWLLTIGSLVVFAGLGLRLGDLQILRHGYYSAVAEGQRQRASELAPHRGTIYLSEGRDGSDQEVFPIASNQRGWIAYAIPRDMEDPIDIARRLAPALYDFRQRQQDRVRTVIAETGQNPRSTPTPTPTSEGEISPPVDPEQQRQDEIDVVQQQLVDKLDRRTDPFEPLLRPYEILDDEFLAFLEQEELPGVVLEEQEVRVYPEKSLAAHVVGYVGYQDEGRIGRYGVEGFFQDELAGNAGFFSSELDIAGRFIGVGNRQFDPAQDGDDIVLTIDRVVQSIIEEELADGVERFAAERGTIIVMNPRTGGILGMATYPTFDPNYYYAINEARVQLNPAVSEIFEPGSILKPLIMAAALNEGTVEADTTMVDSGPVRVANYTIDTYDGKHFGRQTMTQILEQSNNVGMVWVGQQLGAETLYDYLRRFGLGEKTGIDLEGETQTSLTPPDDWNVTTVATASFGQGVALTPLQALNGVNALANNGVLMEPHIVAEVRHSNGETEIVAPASVRQVVSPRTAETISAMLVSVVENGVAQLARVPGYYLAGKTGTAQVPDERGGYSPDRKIISFVGFGPVEDPQFSIIIKLDNPAGLSFASGTAAPMFNNIAEQLLQYYQIPPSYEDRPRQPYTVPTNPDA